MNENDRVEVSAKNVTIYTMGMFGVRKIEARSAEVAVGPWAQYPAAVKVTYVEKGKRKPKGFVESYRPSLVVLDGWGHIDAPQPFEERAGGMITRMASCDPRWQTEFDAALASYLAESGAKVLGDYRAKKEAA